MVWSGVLESYSKIWSKFFVVQKIFDLLAGLEVKGVGSGRFVGRLFLVPRRGLRIIRGSDENPSCMFSAKDFMCNSFITSVLGKDIGGSGFMVKVYGATKFKSGWIEDKDKTGNTFFINLQSANLALNITFVA